VANEEQVKILLQGAEVWNAWREANPDIRPDLSRHIPGFDLRGAKLRGANLRSADLKSALLSDADLRGPTWPALT
jgi:uncharacterized protein YjbI with pentapeptide repeats